MQKLQNVLKKKKFNFSDCRCLLGARVAEELAEMRAKEHVLFSCDDNGVFAPIVADERFSVEGCEVK